MNDISGVADHLAELTGLRDRNLLDLSLVGALRDLLQPDWVAIFRSVGEPASSDGLPVPPCAPAI